MFNVESFQGLGDNIMQRPFIRALTTRGRVFINTPWPEVYSDLPNMNFIPRISTLRTQAKNIARQSRHVWSRCPSNVRLVRLGYSVKDLAEGSIYKAFERQITLAGVPFQLDLPAYDFEGKPNRPYAVIRPVTHRSEWQSESRQCKPEYIQTAIDMCRAIGLDVATVADVEPGREWFDRAEPENQTHKWHHGELDVRQLMGLVRNAACVIGGVGFAVPMTLAYQRPLYVIFGGRGLHNAWERISDPRIDQSRVGLAIPDNFCMCGDANHPCNKQISNFAAGLEAWLVGTVKHGLRLG